MKTEYGIPVPRGVPKDWEACSTDTSDAGWFLRNHGTLSDWGDPSNAVTWFDRFGRIRLCVGHYPNGRSATVRIDANGVWKTGFGDVG